MMSYRYILCSNHKCLHSSSEYLRKYLGSWSAWWKEEAGSHLALGVMKIKISKYAPQYYDENMLLQNHII